ncbi:MAG: hypothetical protein HY291_01385 [Planctomycetes bacterium]|nr:hypothetical protein [Planctomycetota bacterium]
MRTSTLLVVVLVIAAFCVGWLAVKATNDKVNDKSNIEITVDKGKVKRDTSDLTEKAKDIGEKIKQDAKDLVAKSNEPLDSVQSRLSLDRTSIDLLPESQADVTVMRTGGELKALQLGLTASADSNLFTSGGAFNAGDTSTRVTVKAPKGARNGKIAITAEGQTVTLDVIVKR